MGVQVRLYGREESPEGVSYRSACAAEGCRGLEWWAPRVEPDPRRPLEPETAAPRPCGCGHADADAENGICPFARGIPFTVWIPSEVAHYVPPRGGNSVPDRLD